MCLSEFAEFICFCCQAYSLHNVFLHMEKKTPLAISGPFTGILLMCNAPDNYAYTNNNKKINILPRKVYFRLLDKTVHSELPRLGLHTYFYTEKGSVLLL